MFKNILKLLTGGEQFAFHHCFRNTTSRWEKFSKGVECHPRLGNMGEPLSPHLHLGVKIVGQGGKILTKFSYFSYICLEQSLRSMDFHWQIDLNP